jgi:hypothetical protein
MNQILYNTHLQFHGWEEKREEHRNQKNNLSVSKPNLRLLHWWNMDLWENHAKQGRTIPTCTKEVTSQHLYILHEGKLSLHQSELSTSCSGPRTCPAGNGNRWDELRDKHSFIAYNLRGRHIFQALPS